MGFLSAASSWLDSTLATSDGVAVTYRRGSGSAELVAVVGETLFVQEDSVEGTPVGEWRTRDYLIQVPDLELEGNAITPTVGDLIEETIDGREVTHEVLAIAGGPAYRYTDPTETCYRVHTKRVGTST